MYLQMHLRHTNKTSTQTTPSSLQHYVGWLGYTHHLLKLLYHLYIGISWLMVIQPMTERENGCIKSINGKKSSINQIITVLEGANSLPPFAGLKSATPAWQWSPFNLNVLFHTAGAAEHCGQCRIKSQFSLLHSVLQWGRETRADRPHNCRSYTAYYTTLLHVVVWMNH